MRSFVRSLLVLPVLASLAGAQAAAPAPTEWRDEFLAVFAMTADKYVRLAEAIPAERYTWRPAEGVRSVSEVFLHVASANYGLASNLGASPAAGVDARALEKSSTDKAVVVRHLRAAFAHFEAAVRAFPSGEPQRMVRFFNPPQITARHFLYFNADHNGEHLGQMIAYARMLGITPPWSGGAN